MSAFTIHSPSCTRYHFWLGIGMPTHASKQDVFVTQVCSVQLIILLWNNKHVTEKFRVQQLPLFPTAILSLRKGEKEYNGCNIKTSINYVVYALMGLELDWSIYLMCSQVILNSSLHDICVCQFSSLPLSNFDRTKNLGVYAFTYLCRARN